MDLSWLPWCWRVGAVGSAVVFWLVQPWRREWTGGWRLVRKYPLTWLLPAGLRGLDFLMEWFFHSISTAQMISSGSALSGWSIVLRGMAQALQGFPFGRGAALLGMMLLLLNSWGIRRGFLKGVESVTGWRGRGVLGWLGVGFVAILADAALAGRGLPGPWHTVVLALAIPLVGWTSAAVLGGLLLLAETERRAPEKVAEVRWLESAAAHSVRLWPWALGHGLLWWLGHGLPDWLSAYGSELLGPLAVVLAFASLIFLHVKDLSQAATAGRAALGAWRTGWGLLAGWLAGAGMLFYGWHLVRQGLMQAVSDQSMTLRIGLASGLEIVHVGMVVMSLGAWAECCLTEAPPLKRPRSPRR